MAVKTGKFYVPAGTRRLMNSSD